MLIVIVIDCRRLRREGAEEARRQEAGRSAGWRPGAALRGEEASGGGISVCKSVN